MNKEQIHDEQISPLMAQIIEICKEHKIAFVASYAIPTEDDDTLRCSSALLGREYGAPDEFKRAWKELKPGGRGGVMMLRAVDGDGNLTITAIL
jgi:hypothetical protein